MGAHVSLLADRRGGGGSGISLDFAAKVVATFIVQATIWGVPSMHCECLAHPWCVAFLGAYGKPQSPLRHKNRHAMRNSLNKRDKHRPIRPQICFSSSLPFLYAMHTTTPPCRCTRHVKHSTPQACAL